MALNPNFAATPRFGVGVTTVADAGLAAPLTGANAVTFISGAISGTRVENIVIKALASTTLGSQMVRLWLYDGSSYYLWKELQPTTVALSGALYRSYREELDLRADPVILANASWSMKATTHDGTDFNVFAVAGDF